jgi:hypothetical protein
MWAVDLFPTGPNIFLFATRFTPHVLALLPSYFSGIFYIIYLGILKKGGGGGERGQKFV